jgi:uncharacterized membrane protein YhiD involved in acid resistance
VPPRAISIIGFERERLLWAAGIRTHMVVCVGACLVMVVMRRGQVKRFITQGSSKKNDEEAVQALISQISSEQAAGFGRKLASLAFVRDVKAQGRARKFAEG